MTRVRRYLILMAALFVTLAVGCSGNPPSLPSATAAVPTVVAGAKKITTVPARTNASCRKGRAKLYDECGDQLTLLQEARAVAKRENKVVLVSFGAEWCIWCHVFAKYVYGQMTEFSYTYASPDAPDLTDTSVLYERQTRDVSGDARALNAYMADNFVLVHIDAQFAPNGRKVLSKLDAEKRYKGGIPFVFSVGRTGKFAASFESDEVEIRRDTADWYRGYDRQKLLAVLKRLKAAAL